MVGCREGGQCVCNINSDWTMMRQYRELKDIFVRLNTAENILKKLNFTEIYDRLEDFHDRLQFLENHINNQSVDASITELLGRFKIYPQIKPLSGCRGGSRGPWGLTPTLLFAICLSVFNMLRSRPFPDRAPPPNPGSAHGLWSKRASERASE